MNPSESSSASSDLPNSNSEVAALNDKLINAINHQTSLDDRLAQTKQELTASKARIEQLETEARVHEQKISTGQLISKSAFDGAKNKLLADLADEKKQKSLAQQEKRGIELELENLTASLFEEANEMVASANRDRDTMEKKNQQLRDQIRDTEMLLASQHEQLTELKVVMHQMSTDGVRDDTATPQSSTAPASPALNREDNNVLRLLEAMNLSPSSPETSSIPPAPSTSFTHLLKPVCRTDLPAFEDYRSLISASHRSQSHSRVGSGSYGGLNVIGLSSLSNPQTPRNGSSSSLNAAPNLSNSPALPGSFSPSAADAKGPIPLKEDKFFKRLLAEDIEPALRLDLSPTISWLARRSIISALVEGSMIVEPIPDSHQKLYGRYTSCSICGESRKAQENSRTHRMRVSEGEGATKWPLCLLCLEKVRGVGDLVSYVRMIRDGVVKCSDKDEELESWDELVKLRERLFWARMAGGVVPFFVQSTKNSPSLNIDRRATRNSVQAAEADSPIPKTPGENSDSGSGGDDSQDEANQQLQNGLQASVKQSNSTGGDGTNPEPPRTPPQTQKRESGGALKVSIPGTFWSRSVNVMH